MPKLKSILAACASISIASAPLPSFAQSCSQLERQQQSLENEKSRLYEQYPGTLLSLFTCIAVANEADESEQVPVFLICTTGVCLFSGIENCIDIGTRAFNVERRSSEVERQMSREGC
ncbi:hypothetical protein [Aestuariivita sp.]|uniref:hypothetical protein n=1 Tax=Aestuariivita sp. TaxID=1872407 RepID=UPI00216BC5E9|nr:hypothetical protein [Aestuariivita sp.]MCE8005980.1 hypothetical protein [Aestuariivita sp.]